MFSGRICSQQPPAGTDCGRTGAHNLFFHIGTIKDSPVADPGNPDSFHPRLIATVLEDAETFSLPSSNTFPGRAGARLRLYFSEWIDALAPTNAPVPIYGCTFNMITAGPAQVTVSGLSAMKKVEEAQSMVAKGAVKRCIYFKCTTFVM